MRKIAMFTLSYNSEKTIYPFLKSTEGLAKRIILQGKEGFRDDEHRKTIKPDRSEALIRKHFPDVQIIYQNAKNYAEAFNQGLDLLRRYDFVLRFDTDEIFEKHDWEWILEYLHGVPSLDSLKYEFGNAVCYYNDIDHGIIYGDSWIESRGIDPKHDFGFNGLFGGPGFLIRSRRMHHYTGLKGKGLTTQQEKDMLEKYGDNGQWYRTPDSLRKLFEEGERLLEKL